MTVIDFVETKAISKFYEEDHNRLDELFRNYQESKKEDYQKAREYFVSFKFGLQRHIIWEEEVLFPFFEKQAKLMGHGPTEVMRQEHRVIGEALEDIHKKVQASDPNTDELDQRLLDVLGMHNYKEENILYPAIDAYAKDPLVIKKLFDEMRTIPEERYMSCCKHSDHPQITGA